MSIIRCPFCRKLIFDGITLKVRVAQFSLGHVNLKCPQCRNWIEGVSVGLLLDGSPTEGINKREER